MKIVSTATLQGDFVILDSKGKNLLELNYANWFSSRAETTFKRDTIEIVSKNIWQSKFDIFINGTDRGDITFNWKGQVLILIDNKSYFLKTTSIWKLGFDLLDEKERCVLKVKPNLSWKKMKYDYEIQKIDSTVNPNDLTLLVLYTGFATNLWMSQNMYA